MTNNGTQSHIRNTLRMQKLYDVRPNIGEPEIFHIVNKASTHSSLAAIAVDLENNIRNDRVARLFRERKSRDEVLALGIMHDSDTRAPLTAGASSSLLWSIKGDTVSKTLRYRLTREDLEARGIIKYLRGNAYAFQRAAAQARLQRTLALRVSADQLRAMNILNDPIYLARRMLEFNRIRIEVAKMLAARPSLVDVKAQGIMHRSDSIASSTYNQTGEALEKQLQARPTMQELVKRNIITSGTAKDLEFKLISLQLNNKLSKRPSAEDVARYRPNSGVDASLAAASHDLAKSVTSLRLKRSLSRQSSRDELCQRNIVMPGTGIAANMKALDMAMRADRLNNLIKDLPLRDDLVAKNILVQDSYPKSMQAQAKSLEFALTQLRLKSHIEARHSLSKLNTMPTDNEFVIVSSCA